jgi:hypothetical protein
MVFLQNALFYRTSISATLGTDVAVALSKEGKTMRQVLSLLLISILILPAAPVSAQNVSPNSELGERLRNMSEEVERFRQSRIPEDWAARYIIQEISKDTPIEVRLRNGSKEVGRIVNANQGGFTLDNGRQVAFKDVASVQTSGGPHLNKTGKILIAVGVAIFVVWFLAVGLKQWSESV